MFADEIHQQRLGVNTRVSYAIETWEYSAARENLWSEPLGLGNGCDGWVVTAGMR
jgi:hypothetical protein